jgi:hypothetical protein
MHMARYSGELRLGNQTLRTIARELVQAGKYVIAIAGRSVRAVGRIFANGRRRSDPWPTTA